MAQLVLFDGKKILDHDEEEDEYTIPWGGRKVSFTGTKANQTVVSDSPDGKLTVCFSNANGIAPGWKATVSSLPATPLPADEVRIGISPSPQIVGNTPLNFYDDGGKKGKILQD